MTQILRTLQTAVILFGMAVAQRAAAQSIYPWLSDYPPAQAHAISSQVEEVARDNGIPTKALASAIQHRTTPSSRDVSALVADIERIGGQIATMQAQLGELDRKVQDIPEGPAHESAVAEVRQAHANLASGDLTALSKNIGAIATLPDSHDTEEARIQAIMAQADLLQVSSPRAAFQYTTNALAAESSRAGRLELETYLDEIKLADAVERGDRGEIESLHRTAAEQVVSEAEGLGNTDLSAGAWLLVAHTDDALLKWSQQAGAEYRDALVKALSLVGPERNVNRWAAVTYTIAGYDASSGRYKDAIDNYELVLNQPKLDPGAALRGESYFGEGNAYLAWAGKQSSKADTVALVSKALTANDAAAEFYKQRVGKTPMRMIINGASDMAAMAAELNDPEGLLKAAHTVEVHRDDPDRLILPASWAHVQAIIANQYHFAGILFCRANRVTDCVAALAKAKNYYDRCFESLKREMAPELFDQTTQNAEENRKVLEAAIRAAGSGGSFGP